MLERLKNQEKRRRPTDAQLHERALKLSEKYLGSQAHPKSVTWSSSQNRRWGSCTPATGSIRISDRLKGMPHWVLDYVLLHELAHMITPDHSSQFWALLDRKSTRLNSSHVAISYAVFCLKKKIQ